MSTVFFRGRRAALEKWKEKLGRNATYGNLMCAFKKANNLSYADKVREVYCKSYNTLLTVIICIQGCRVGLQIYKICRLHM